MTTIAPTDARIAVLSWRLRAKPSRCLRSAVLSPSVI